MGHSLQAVAVLAQAAGFIGAVPVDPRAFTRAGLEIRRHGGTLADKLGAIASVACLTKR